MDTSTLDRRTLLRGASTAGAVMVGGVALASSAEAGEDGRHHGIEGSYLITHQAKGGPPVKAVASFTAGGVLLDVELAPAGATGAGTWRHRGDGRFTGTFWFGQPAVLTGGPDILARVRVAGRRDGDRIVGTYRATFFDPHTDTEVGTERGTFWGRRIEA